MWDKKHSHSQAGGSMGCRDARLGRKTGGVRKKDLVSEARYGTRKCLMEAHTD